MLSKHVVDQVVDLLKRGDLSQRKIAEMLGVSRGTIGAIATGKRGAYGREQEPDADPAPIRCAVCGRLVVGRCIACDVEAYSDRKSSETASAISLPDGEGPGFNDLTPAEIRRRARMIRESRTSRSRGGSPLQPIEGVEIPVVACQDIRAAMSDVARA